jgi:hypothetical protein
MRFAALVVTAVSLSTFGCATETNITRTVHHTNGSTEVYENKSKGYNYNPNFTGTAEQSVHVRDYGYGYGFGYNGAVPATQFGGTPAYPQGGFTPTNSW